MSIKTTTILMILLILVGGAYWYTQIYQKPAAPAPADAQTNAGQGQKLLDVDAGDVTGITITDSQNQRTTISKIGDVWKMTEPVSAAAIDWQTRDLIRTICDLRSRGRPQSAPSDDGLDKPRYEVDLSTSEGKTIRLALGNRTGIGDVMYAQVDGGDVNLIDSALAKTLKTAPTDLRDKKLLTLSSMDVKQIRITSGNQKISLVQDNGKWKITEPVDLPGDSSSISSLLSSIADTEATEFVPANSDELAFAGFEHPTMQIWISTAAPTTAPSTTEPSATEPADSNSQTLTIGSPDSLSKDHYFVQTSTGLYAKIAGTSLDNLKKTQWDLRDKDIVSILPGDVTRISIVKDTFSPAVDPLSEKAPKPSTNSTVVLARRPKPPAPAMGPAAPSSRPSTQPSTTQPAVANSVWMFNQPGDAKAQIDDSKVDTLLSKFNPLRADKFLEKPPMGKYQTIYVVTIDTQPAGSTSPQSFNFIVTRPADSQPPFASYNHLDFEIPAAAADALDADFHQTATP